MAIEHSDIETIETLIVLAGKSEKFAGCSNLYDLLGIAFEAPTDAVLSAIDSFGKWGVANSTVKKNAILAKLILSAEPPIRRILVESRDDYNLYLLKKELDKVYDYFVRCTDADKELHPAEKRNLVHQFNKLGISDDKADEVIRQWMKDAGVKEAEESGTGTTFFDFFGQTYYEILGISETASQSEIQEAYDREYRKTLTVSDKSKADARRYEIRKALDVLKDPAARAKYDRSRTGSAGGGGTVVGTPKLYIDGKKSAKYVYTDVRRGAIFTEKIVIRNVDSGQLRGTIKPDVPWIEPERDKLLDKHEQELEFKIVTSRIPAKAKSAVGNLNIDTNGGKDVIPCEVLLKRNIKIPFKIRHLILGAAALYTLIVIFIHLGGNNSKGPVHLEPPNRPIQQPPTSIRHQPTPTPPPETYSGLPSVGWYPQATRPVVNEYFQNRFEFDVTGVEVENGRIIVNFKIVTLTSNEYFFLCSMKNVDDSVNSTWKPYILDSKNIRHEMVGAPMGDIEKDAFSRNDSRYEPNRNYRYRLRPNGTTTGRMQFRMISEGSRKFALVIPNVNGWQSAIRVDNIQVIHPQTKTKSVSPTPQTPKSLLGGDALVAKAEVGSQIPMYKDVVAKEMTLNGTFYPAGSPVDIMRRLAKGEIVDVLNLFENDMESKFTCKIRTGEGESGYVLRTWLEIKEAYGEKGDLLSLYLSLPYEYEGDVEKLNEDISKLKSFIAKYPNSPFITQVKNQIDWRQKYGERIRKSSTPINLTRSVIAAGVDGRNEPIGISSRFDAGNKQLCYYVSFTGGVPNRTKFDYLWFKGQTEIERSGYTVQYANGNAWTFLRRNFEPGDYQVRLLVDGKEKKRTPFTVLASSRPPVQRVQPEPSRPPLTPRQREQIVTPRPSYPPPSSGKNQYGQWGKALDAGGYVDQ